MAKGQGTVSQELRHFVDEYAGDYYALSLLLFFADYPYARFNRLAIIHALDTTDGRLQVQQALDRLINIGLIDTCVDNDTTLYYLGKNQTSRNLVLQIGKLAMSQRQLLLRKASAYLLKTVLTPRLLPVRSGG